MSKSSGLKERIIFRLRDINFFIPRLRTLYFKLAGMRVGTNTRLPELKVTWPHQVAIGNKCRLEHGIYFHYDGIYSPGPSITIGDHSFIGNNCEFNISQSIEIGANALIAAGCRFIDHDHNFESGQLIRVQKCSEGKITIGQDVWLGCHVVVLKGITIGDGAIVGAGSIVTKSIPANEIWVGVPAKKIGIRPV